MSAKIETAPRASTKVSPYKHTWVRADNGLLSLVFGHNSMLIWEENGVWISTATLRGKKYRAERATLEYAAKAADRLLYKTFPHVWTVTDARVIIAPWKGDLACQ
jgi:hypothetical protein